MLVYCPCPCTLYAQCKARSPLSLGSPALLPPLALHSMLPAHVASQHSALCTHSSTSSTLSTLSTSSTHLVPSTLARHPSASSTLAPWRDVTTCSAQCLAASKCPPRRPTPHCRLLLAAPPSRTHCLLGSSVPGDSLMPCLNTGSDGALRCLSSVAFASPRHPPPGHWSLATGHWSRAHTRTSLSLGACPACLLLLFPAACMPSPPPPPTRCPNGIPFAHAATPFLWPAATPR
jgi:hypothetical protein